MDTFVVAPSPALVAWALLVLTGLVGTAITLAKGRPGLTLICLLTGGLLGNVTAFLPARTDTFWTRHVRRARP